MNRVKVNRLVALVCACTFSLASSPGNAWAEERAGGLGWDNVHAEDRGADLSWD